MQLNLNLQMQTARYKRLNVTMIMRCVCLDACEHDTWLTVREDCDIFHVGFNNQAKWKLISTGTKKQATL